MKVEKKYNSLIFNIKAYYLGKKPQNPQNVDSVILIVVSAITEQQNNYIIISHLQK